MTNFLPYTDIMKISSYRKEVFSEMIYAIRKKKKMLLHETTHKKITMNQQIHRNNITDKKKTF